MTTDFPATPQSDSENRSIIFNSYQRARALLALSAIAAFILFWFTGHFFHIPFEHGYQDSLLWQPGNGIVFLIVAIGLGISVLIGVVVAGSIRFDAGLCTACLGLMALSVRGGGMRYILFAHPGAPTYLALVFELILLFILLGAAAFFQQFLHSLGASWLKADALRDGLVDVDHTRSDQLKSALLNIVIMGFIVYFLATSDKKFQVIAAVAIGSFVGTAIAYAIFPVRPSVWFWIGPLIVGAVGYLWAFAQAGDFKIGAVANPLAAPLPLDYASIGPAAAIVAYWMSRRWRRDRVEA